MNKIGIIVDGDGDYASIKKKFKERVHVLKTDGPRGHCADTNQIVSRSKKQVRMLKGFKCSKIIVLLDYECRRVSYSKYSQILKDYFLSVYKDNNMFVCLPNIMIENWYLADIEHLSRNKKYIRDNVTQKNYEGQNGKNQLKRLFCNNISYSEVKHGPELFCLIRTSIAQKNSKSFAEFLSLIDEDAV